MSFGLQNLGVINQRQSPAIWQSDFADFPINFIEGRILIDTFQGGIYLDTSSSRVQIQASGAGLINYSNGVQTYGITTPTTQNVGLGGTIDVPTQIIMNDTLDFSGSFTTFTLTSDGAAQDGQTGNLYFPVEPSALTGVVPDTLLIFINPLNGDSYKVLAELV